MLHGCGSLAQEIILPFEGSHARIIAPDRPGYGFSTPLPLKEQGPLGQSFWLERLLRYYDLSRTTIVAHSIAAAPALHLAVRRPEMVDKLLLLSPCCRPVPPRPYFALRCAVAPVIGAMIRRHISMRWANVVVEKALRSSSHPNPVPAHLCSLPCHHMIAPLAIQTMASEMRAFNTDMAHLPNLSRDIKLRVLFGAQDQIVEPQWHLDWIRRKHPSPGVKVLDGVGHLPHHTARDVTLEILNELHLGDSDIGAGHGTVISTDPSEHDVRPLSELPKLLA
ncbi:pimeloyl-ACP methyl ester carboxylesterase [Rhizobium sp. ERR 1071]|nr:pimeloyl-ACP methyl ester carboxylesterase [Rhizobium sp. ERR1071]